MVFPLGHEKPEFLLKDCHEIKRVHESLHARVEKSYRISI